MEQQQNRYNMLAGQQGVGFRAGGALSDLSQTYGSNMANYAMKAGGIEAAKTAAKYSMYGDILNAGTNAFSSYMGGKAPSVGGGASSGANYGGYGSYDLNNPFSTNWGK